MIDTSENQPCNMAPLCLKNVLACYLQVAWEVQTAAASLARSDNVYDLFLLGSMSSGVKSVPAQRRPNTETYVYCFNGANNGKLGCILDVKL